MSPDFRDRLIALAHAIEPLMMLAFDAESFVAPAKNPTSDGLLKMRPQLTRFQVWLFDQAKRGTR